MEIVSFRALQLITVYLLKQNVVEPPFVAYLFIGIN